MITLSETEHERWAEKARSVTAEHKKEIMSKGYGEQELDACYKYSRERIEYWTKIEKERKIPTPFE